MQIQKTGIERSRNITRFRSIDFYLVVPVILLTIIGIYVLNKVLSEGYAAYPGNLYRQIAAAMLGIFCALVICFIDTQLLKVLSWIIYASAMFLLLLVPLDNYSMMAEWGADAWLNLPVLGNFQPSELAKIGLVMVVADLFERMNSKEFSMWKGLGLIAAVYAPPMLLIFKQPDFGTAMVIAFSFVCVLFVWGVKYRYFLLAASLGIVAGIPLVWNFYLEGYQKKRILSLVFEGSDPKAEYNLVQSKLAIASGGLAGNNTGIRVSVPVKESDFIYSAVSEHLGFIGTTVLLCLAFFFICRCLYVASKCNKASYSYIIIGIAAAFAFHFIENMGMSVGLLPITGIPLPFISLGGTSLLVNYISFGIILNISMNRQQEA